MRGLRLLTGKLAGYCREHRIQKIREITGGRR